MSPHAVPDSSAAIAAAAVGPLDHRRLGQDLDYVASADLIGPGLPLWLPDGAAVVAELERYVSGLERDAGYRHVRTPVLGKRRLYERSGHWSYFADDMFPAMSLGGDDLVLRPVLCPHHALVFGSRPRRRAELPLRLAETGPMYRAERSGVLSGLTRVRSITLNDAHLFCAPDQVVDEVCAALRLVDEAYDLLGIVPVRVVLAGRGDSAKFAGDDASWARAEAYLREALRRHGVEFEQAPGEAAFYGPKIDLQVLDAQGREFTLSTVQVDLHQPEQFSLEYVAPGGDRERPVMVHRSVLSSMERMVAYLLERYAGALPPWLAPVQLRVLPVRPEQRDAAAALAGAAREAGLRVDVDDRDDTLGARIRTAHGRRIPYVGVVGAREAADGTAALRVRDGGRSTMAVADAVRAIGSVARRRSRDTTLA